MILSVPINGLFESTNWRCISTGRWYEAALIFKQVEMNIYYRFIRNI